MTIETSAHPDGRRRPVEVPPLSVPEIQSRLAEELSRRARIGHTLLLLVNLTIAIGVMSLLATEPALPLRAQVAFVLMLGIALSWSAFAWWTLTRRQVLLAGHEIVAGRMAVTFTSVLVAGSLVLAAVGPSVPAAIMSAGLGCVPLAAAWLLLRRARRQFDALLQRREALEQALRASTESRP
jgi:hypothetical protein